MEPKQVVARVRKVLQKIAQLHGECVALLEELDARLMAGELEKSIEVAKAKKIVQEELFQERGSHGGSSVEGGKVIDFAGRRASRTTQGEDVDHGGPGNAMAAVALSPPVVVREDDGGPDAVERDSHNAHRLRVLQDRLVALLDLHEADFSEALDQLGCRGDCYRCPHPEHATIGEQVVGCLRGAVESLGLDQSLLEVDT